MSDFQIAVMTSLAWKLPLTILLVALGEWTVHYVAMHRKLAGFHWVYQWHHIEHHARGHNNLRPHIDLVIQDYVVVLPFFLGALYRIYLGHPGGWSGAVSMISVCSAHCYLWNRMHRNIHEIEGKGNWTKKLWFYPAFEQHHIDHHRHPFYNYGVVFPWTDRILGTKWKE